jgi:hypothetical protein
MDIARTIVAMVHDRAGGALTAVLSGGENPFIIKTSDGLLKQLEDTSVTLPRVSAGFVGDIAVNSLATLLNKFRSVSGAIGPGAAAGGAKLPSPAEFLAQVRNVVRSQLSSLQSPKAEETQPRGAIENLVGLLDREESELGQGIQGFQGRLDSLLKGLVRPGDDDAGVLRLRQILGNDIGAVMPLAAIASAVQGLQHPANVPESLEEGLLAYFFSPDGFKTVDGESVIAPVHLSDLKAIAAGAVDVGPGLDIKVSTASVKQLKGLFTTATAERYLRDTIRVIVESAYDAVRGFKDSKSAKGLYSTVTEKLQSRSQKDADRDAVVNKFVVWFRGFSSMAESATMRAVEVGTQGVSEFQTNPLIAAAAGAFAGTVARKLAQGAFLEVLSTELHTTSQ